MSNDDDVMPDTLETIDDFRRRLDAAVREAAPQVAALAEWLARRPDEAAFLSVRQLAAAAGTNANTVIRLSGVLGFHGFGAMQAAVRSVLRQDGAYAQRAAALTSQAPDTLPAEMLRAAHTGVDALYSAPVRAQISACTEALLKARQVHCIGVRSCYSIAHYLSYAGSMALSNFQPPAAQPGMLTDQMSSLSPEDIVIAITYAHYSAEVVRACEIAQECGARIIALTDSYASPIARGAWQVFRLSMEGPQLLPSLLPAFHLCEILLAELATADPGTQSRLRDFEQRMLRTGGYIRARSD